MKMMRVVKIGLRFTVAVMAAGILQAESVPGLWEARYASRLVNANTTYPANLKERVTLGPFAANAKNNNVVVSPVDNTVTNWPPFGVAAKGWNSNISFYYTGYMYINEGSNTVTFAAGFDDMIRLCIDDVEILRATTYSTMASVTRTFATGWHKFDVWFDNGTGSYGPAAWSPNDIGFGVDWQGRGVTTRANFEFPQDPGDGSLFSAEMPPNYADISSLPAQMVTGSSADLPARVAMRNASGKLRVYYGLTDGGKVESAWTSCVELENSVNATGEYVIPVTGLVEAQTYYYRHAFEETHHGRVFFSPVTYAVTPLSSGDPASFRWIGGVGTAVWHTPLWLNLDDLMRTMPGAPGDKVFLTNNIALTVNNGIAFAELTQAAAYSSSIVPGVSGVTLSLDALGGTSKITAVAKSSLTLGSDSVRMNLALQNPLMLTATSDGNATELYLKARLTGGAEDALRNITCFGAGGRPRITLSNPANDFRGDLHLSTNSYVIVGRPDAQNSMFGHVANKIIFDHTSGKLIIWPGAFHPVLDRTIQGSGSIEALTITTDGYNNSNDARLSFGSNALIEPSSANGTTGTISIIGSAITFDTNATVRLDLMSATQCDLLSVKHYQGSLDTYYKRTVDHYVFSNRLELIAASSDFPIGTQWTIMRVEQAKAFTFQPSYKTPGYGYEVIGSESPWTLVAIKLDSGPAVQNLAATEVDAAQAQVGAEVLSLEPEQEGTLRVYYGETDGGASPSAWTSCAVYPDQATAVGSYRLTLTEGLSAGHTYYYRHSISNSAGEKFAATPWTFTTYAFEAPDTFTWLATNANWFAPGVWQPNRPSVRKTPQFMGDKVIINLIEGGLVSGPLVSRSIELSEDVVVSSVQINDGENHSVTFTATGENPVVLTFDTPDGTPFSFLAVGSLRDLNFGTSLSTPLVLALNKPFVFHKTAAYQYNIPCYARLIGGTDAAPSDITLSIESSEWGHVHFSLINPANSFRGDLYVGNRISTTAGTVELRVGRSGVAPATDSTLGHPDNKIILQRNSALSLVAPAAEEPATLNRKVSGNGVISAGLADQGGGYDNLLPQGKLHLGSGATLMPHAQTGAEGMGALTIAATGLSGDANARYIFKVNPETQAADVINVNVTGPVDLQGRVKLQSTSHPMPIGMTWDIMKIAPTATQFENHLKIERQPNLPYVFRLSLAGDATTGWTVQATSVNAYTVLQLR